MAGRLVRKSDFNETWLAWAWTLDFNLEFVNSCPDLLTEGLMTKIEILRIFITILTPLLSYKAVLVPYLFDSLENKLAGAWA